MSSGTGTGFDAEGNMVDVAGRIIVPREAVSQYVSAMQHQQPQQALAQFRANDGFAYMPSLARQRPSVPQLLPPAPPGSPAARPTSSPSPSSASGHTRRQAVGHRASLATPDTNNTYGEAVPSYADRRHNCTATSGRTAGASSSSGLPQESSAALGSYFASSESTWPPSVSAPGLLYDPSPSHSSPQNPRNPSIRVTNPWDGSGDQDYSQPQDALYSASSASPLPHEFPPYNNIHQAGHLSLPAYSMPQESENMQTPVSPVSATANSPQDQSMGEPQIQQFPSRKRSHSVMSQQAEAALMNNTQHSRSGSVASQAANSPNDVVEEYPRGSRAFKRGEAPQNSEGKYICAYSEDCQGLFFDRKCEWSKHMDKHDRPYRCQHQSCAKLQGFTYSGGLLRHEREVHGKHGGPKAQLMCPHPECKRHSGKGFTRKENLNEHLRRVHASSKEDESQQSLLQSANEYIGAQEEETPASHASDAVEHELAAPPAKRKRSLPPSAEDDLGEDGDATQQEIKQLRELLAAKDQQISNLHAEVMQMEQSRQQLQTTILQMQQQQQPSQG